jgi:hypothetical protein
MTNPTPPEHLAAAAELMASAGEASSKIDAFATWLLAGYGAAIVLWIDKGSNNPIVSPWVMRFCARLFFWSVLAVVLQKYISLIVTGAAHGTQRGLDGAKRRAEMGLPRDLDMRVYSEAMISAQWQPMRSVMKWLIGKSMGGDILAPARFMFAMAQAQGLLTLAEVTLFLVALGTVIRNAQLG